MLTNATYYVGGNTGVKCLVSAAEHVNVPTHLTDLEQIKQYFTGERLVGVPEKDGCCDNNYNYFKHTFFYGRAIPQDS